MAAPAKKGVDIALVFGGGKPKDKGTGMGMGAGDSAEPDADDASGETEPDPGFTTAAEEAFPDMAGDKDRVGALYRAIMLCK